MTWQAVLDALPLALPAAACGAVLAVAAVALVARRRRRQRTDLPSVRSDVAELAGQLEDYARQIDRQVTERLDRLEALLAAADGKGQELRRLLEAAKTGDDSRPHPRGADDQVVALAAQGLDSVEIARRLRMDVGEVELMLNLHRSHASPRP
jgi:type II secretory pathway component PulM